MGTAFFSGTSLHLVVRDFFLLRQTTNKDLCQEVRSTQRSCVCRNAELDFSLHLVIQTYIYISYVIILLDADYGNQRKEMK